MNKIHHWIEIQSSLNDQNVFSKKQIYESKISFSKQKKELISDHSNKHNRIQNLKLKYTPKPLKIQRKI